MHNLPEATQIITSIAAIRSMCAQFTFVLVSNNTSLNVIKLLVIDGTFVVSQLIPFDHEKELFFI